MTSRESWERGGLRVAAERSVRGAAKRALQAVGAQNRPGLNDSLRKIPLSSDFVRWKTNVARPLFTDRDTRATEVLHHVRFQLYQFLLDRHRLDAEPVNYYEFGVAGGESLRWWSKHARHPASAFIGFDTFQGLPEDWRNKPKGTFSTGGKTPDITDDRVRYEVGLFQDTVQPFFASNEPKARAIYHLDADLYSSTLLCLFAISPRLVPGDILVFDEFSDLLHEFRAWQDFTSAFSVEYEVVGGIVDYTFVAIELR